MNMFDVVGMSTAMAQTQTLSAVGYAVMDMQLDAAQTEGANMAAILENSVNPAVGSNIDYRV
ncbi:MAG: YjfB family protein [Lachnospiraceae bacterium]|nr:YjfB family protein [Lachnospiraceae bacterium]